MSKVEFAIPIYSVTETIRKEAENKAKECLWVMPTSLTKRFTFSKLVSR